jgi:cysteine desulfurase
MRIYLDHAATTPIHPEVKKAMKSAMDQFGNPSSLHQDGRKAKDLIDQAREFVSAELKALFAEVIFTGSGSESANMAIIGAALANENPNRNQILLSSVEHHCVLNTEPILRRLGYQVEFVPSDSEGFIDPELVEAMASDRTLLISTMHANNEFGTIQWANSIGSVAERVGAIYHCDMVQTFMKGIGHVDNAQLITVAAHKINGPKGVGALFVRGGTKVKPIIVGGEQEREQRAGTENLIGIVGFGKAVQVRQKEKPQVELLRDTFERIIEQVGVVKTVLNKDRLAGHCHVRFPGIDSETLLIRLDRVGISASTGAACSSGSIEPSHVMVSAGYSEIEAKEGIRFTFGYGNTIDEAETSGHLVAQAVQDIRAAKSANAS